VTLVCVYEGVGPTDAYLLQHWLEDHGVKVEVQGQHRMGIQGAVPFPDVWPSLWVTEAQVELALELVKKFHEPREVAPAWVCPGCGERVEATFGSCWKCDTVRPSDASAV